MSEIAIKARDELKRTVKNHATETERMHAVFTKEIEAVGYLQAKCQQNEQENNLLKVDLRRTNRATSRKVNKEQTTKLEHFQQEIVLNLIKENLMERSPRSWSTRSGETL